MCGDAPGKTSALYTPAEEARLSTHVQELEARGSDNKTILIVPLKRRGFAICLVGAPSPSSEALSRRMLLQEAVNPLLAREASCTF